MKYQNDIKQSLNDAYIAEFEALTGETGIAVKGLGLEVVNSAVAAVQESFYYAHESASGHTLAGTPAWYKEAIGALFIDGYGVIGKNNIRFVNQWKGAGTAAVVLMKQIGAPNFPHLEQMSGDEVSTNQIILSAIRNFCDANSVAGMSETITIDNCVDVSYSVRYDLRLNSSAQKNIVETEIIYSVTKYLAGVDDGNIIVAELQAIPSTIDGIDDWKLIEPDTNANLAIGAFGLLTPAVTFNYL